LIQLLPPAIPIPRIEMSQDDQPEGPGPFDWSPAIDHMLARYCDKAKCFEWMHTEAYTYYDKGSKGFIIATNCLTAISGISNVIAGSYTINGFQLAWIFGGISIAVSTLNILQDKLGYNTSGTLHMKYASDWNSVKAKIEEVLTLPYSGRKDCRTFLRYIKDDIGKTVVNGNSIIPQHIRDACYKKFSTIPDFDIPDICGQLEHTRVIIEPIKQHLLPFVA